MNQFESILDKYKELGEFLDTIDVTELRKNHTRKELKEFTSQLYAVKTRSLSYEISKMTDEMKLEEYPELLGIHHFPVLKEITFLTEEQKLKLDEYLSHFRKGNYLSGLWKITHKDSKSKEIENFLLEKGVVIEEFRVQCPNCSDEYLSNFMNKEEKEALDTLLKQESDWDRYEALEEKLYQYCEECSYEHDFETLKEVVYKTYLHMEQERDKRLDMV